MPVIRNLSLSEVEVRCKQGWNLNSGASTDNSDMERWHGETLENAERYLLYGWEEGADKVHPLVRKFTEKFRGTQHRKVARRSVTGRRIAIDRFLKGEPDSCVQYKKVTKTGGRILRIISGGAISAHYTPNDIFKRGSVILSLVNILEIKGYSVEVDLDFCVTVLNDYISHKVRIKNSNQMLNMSMMAFYTCNAAMNRRVMFGVKETEPEDIRRRFNFYKDRGYGRPTTPVDVEDYDIVIPENVTPEFITQEVEKWFQQ